MSTDIQLRPAQSLMATIINGVNQKFALENDVNAQTEVAIAKEISDVFRDHVKAQKATTTTSIFREAQKIDEIIESKHSSARLKAFGEHSLKQLQAL